MERVASAKGHGTLAQHERTDRVQNRLKLREGVGGRANPRGKIIGLLLIKEHHFELQDFGISDAKAAWLLYSAGEK